jgi:hypothetical protein
LVRRRLFGFDRASLSADIPATPISRLAELLPRRWGPAGPAAEPAPASRAAQG